MKANIVDISPPIPYLAKFVFSVCGPKSRQSIFRKVWGMKLIFLPEDKHKSFLQIDSITLGVHS